MPHKGPRGSPITDARVIVPAINTAAATVVSGATDTSAPFTMRETDCAGSDMRSLRRLHLTPAQALNSVLAYPLQEAPRQVRLGGNLCCLAQHSGDQKPRRRQRRRNPQAFLKPPPQKKIFLFCPRLASTPTRAWVCRA